MRRERQNHDEEANHDRWLISYADFITLMFAFFVVMYSISSVSEGKYRVLSDSLTEAFDGVQGVEAEVPMPIALPIKQQLPYEQIGLENESEQIAGESETQLATVNEQDEMTAKGLAEKDRTEKSMGEIADDIRYEVYPFIDDKLINVSNTEDAIEVEIKSQLLFPSGNARLVSKAIPVLSNLATIFSTFSNPIEVRGFTDDRPIKTTAFPSNWELSAARAASVVHLFMRKGIEPKRMSAIGLAEFHPIADNSTEAGRQENRRVVIIIPTLTDKKDVIEAN